jgi:hypothetical protein
MIGYVELIVQVLVEECENVGQQRPIRASSALPEHGDSLTPLTRYNASLYFSLTEIHHKPGRVHVLPAEPGEV